MDILVKSALVTVCFWAALGIHFIVTQRQATEFNKKIVLFVIAVALGIAGAVLFGISISQVMYHVQERNQPEIVPNLIKATIGLGMLLIGLIMVGIHEIFNSRERINHRDIKLGRDNFKKIFFNEAIIDDVNSIQSQLITKIFSLYNEKQVEDTILDYNSAMKIVDGHNYPDNTQPLGEIEFNESKIPMIPLEINIPGLWAIDLGLVSLSWLGVDISSIPDTLPIKVTFCYQDCSPSARPKISEPNTFMKPLFPKISDYNHKDIIEDINIQHYQGGANSDDVIQIDNGGLNDNGTSSTYSFKFKINLSSIRNSLTGSGVHPMAQNISKAERTFDSKVYSEHAGIFIGLQALNFFFPDIEFWTNQNPKELSFNDYNVIDTTESLTGLKKGSPKIVADYRTSIEGGGEHTISIVECKGRVGSINEVFKAIYIGERQVMNSWNVSEKVYQQGFVTSLIKNQKVNPTEFNLVIEILNKLPSQSKILK